MGCRIERVDPWRGKEMTFLRASMALIGTQEALPKALDDEDRRRLTEVAHVLHGALAWTWFLGRDFPAACVPDRAAEALQLLARVPFTAALTGSEREEKLKELLATINGIILGQAQMPMAVAEAARFCSETCDYLMQRWAHDCSDDDEDD